MSYNMKHGNKKVSFDKLRTLPGIEKSPLEPTALKYEKNANDFINRKNQEAYNKTLAKRTSLDNPEHKGDSDEAIEARQNDHDTDSKGKAQTHPKNYAIKEARAGDAQEKKEDAAGVGSGSNRKVMKNGAKNNAVYKGKPVKGDFTPHQFDKK